MNYKNLNSEIETNIKSATRSAKPGAMNYKNLNPEIETSFGESVKSMITRFVPISSICIAISPQIRLVHSYQVH